MLLVYHNLSLFLFKGACHLVGTATSFCGPNVITIDFSNMQSFESKLLWPAGDRLPSITPYQGSKLRPIRSPMGLTFHPWQLKIPVLVSILATTFLCVDDE